MENLPIMIEEVVRAMAQIKKDKSPGPDNIYGEFLKLLDEEGVSWLTKLFNRIYNSGSLPHIWLKTTFVTLPKKPSAKRCDDFRTVSFMSHLLKLFLKIIYQRIFRICEEQMSNIQFGFRNAMGIREAIFSLQVLFQRARDVNQNIYACFIDYQKAFDNVKHNKLIKILDNVGVDKGDLRIINNLYWNQRAVIRVDGELSEEVLIKRGVRQGCVLSPLLFNIYSEFIFREALEGIEDGIKINGEYLNNIRYADDTVIFTNDIVELQYIMDRVVKVSERYGLILNTKKTKFMIISKNHNLGGHLIIKN
jgi:hypothetical protein